MFKKTNPLQSKSEIILRNIVVLAMVIFFTVFLIVPIGIAFAGSFHEWNPLSGTYRFLGLENYKEVFTSALFGKSMLNTVIFSVVVIVFRVGLGLGIAYAIYSTLIKYKSFFRAVYYMPVVTPMVAVAFVWKFMYNPQIGTINKIFGLDVNWLMNPKTALLAIMIMTIWKDFGYAVVMYMAGLYSLPTDALEAARIDGANEFYIFHKIVLPMSKNGIFSIAIFQFLWTWEDFLWPYLVITNKDKQLLAVGLKMFNGQYSTDYGALFAATAISIIPVLLIYLFFQKQFIAGIAASAVKG